MLLSERNGRYYIGHTNSIERRLQQHNAGQVISTRNIRPLRLVYRVEYADGTEARKREHWLKSQKSRKLIEDLVQSVDAGL